MKKFLIFALLPLVLWGCSPTEEADDTHSGQLSATESLVFDFGTVDINGGLISQDFALTNTGKSAVKLYELVTSCGCTSAEIIVGDKTYGPYGMRPESIDLEVSPNEDFVVRLTYDPLFHGPNDKGQRQRTAFLFSSSHADGKVVRLFTDKPNFTEFKIQGIVE